MKTNQPLLALLCISFFCFSCGDEPVEQMLPTHCFPKKITEVVDDTTSLTLMELGYDAENRIQTIFIHEHLTEWTLIHKTTFTYDSANKLLSATYSVEGSSTPPTEFDYVYEEDQLVEINSVISYPTFEINEKQLFSYAEDGFIDFVSIIMDSMVISSQSISRDQQGNQTYWTNFGVSGANIGGPGSNTGAPGESTINFDPNHKGPFADLEYPTSVAYRFTTDASIMLTKHALERQIFAIVVGANPGAELRIFTNSTFNDLNYQTAALDELGTGYIFEYDCQ